MSTGHIRRDLDDAAEIGRPVDHGQGAADANTAEGGQTNQEVSDAVAADVPGRGSEAQRARDDAANDEIGADRADVDRAAKSRAAEYHVCFACLTRHTGRPDREVLDAVVVEIGCGEREAEEVGALGADDCEVRGRGREVSDA
jgi:hypothetical protein